MHGDNITNFVLYQETPQVDQGQLMVNRKGLLAKNQALRKIKIEDFYNVGPA